jgi:hypothetical protein
LRRQRRGHLRLHSADRFLWVAAGPRSLDVRQTGDGGEMASQGLSTRCPGRPKISTEIRALIRRMRPWPKTSANRSHHKFADLDPNAVFVVILELELGPAVDLVRGIADETRVAFLTYTFVRSAQCEKDPLNKPSHVILHWAVGSQKLLPLVYLARPKAFHRDYRQYHDK